MDAFERRKHTVMRNPKGLKVLAAKEGEENPEVMRGTISFDFVFDKSGKPYCVEFGGHNSGVGGTGKAQKLMARIRSRINPDENRREDQLQEKWLVLARKQAHTPEEREKLNEEIRAFGREERSLKFAQHANQNPDWLEWTSGDKKEQVRYIPKEHRPQTIREGNFGHFFNTAKFVVLKGRHSAKGAHVEILTREELERKDPWRHGYQLLSGERIIIQELIDSRGADLAPPELKGNAASLRLSVDFRVYKNGLIIPEEIQGHQRVSTVSRLQVGQKDKDGKEITLKDALVVNMALGAKSVDMSKEEYKAVFPVAKHIIENLVRKKVNANAEMVPVK